MLSLGKPTTKSIIRNSAPCKYCVKQPIDINLLAGGSKPSGRTGVWQQDIVQTALRILQLAVEGSAHCGWVICNGTINPHIGDVVIQLLHPHRCDLRQ